MENLNRQKYTLGILIVLAIFIVIIKISSLKPEDFFDSHEGLQKELTESLKSKIKDGLIVFKSKNGHYPITHSKYYLDSIIEQYFHADTRNCVFHGY